jgi:putative alpha-1,2-mannosidase
MTMRKLKWSDCRILCVLGLLGWFAVSGAFALLQSSDSIKSDPAALVNPLIGTTNGGNDYPGATLPLGMLAWSPEQPRNRPRPQVQGVPGSMRDDRGRPAAPGGYEYSSNRISGFSLTHLMGTGALEQAATFLLCRMSEKSLPLLPMIQAQRYMAVPFRTKTRPQMPAITR